MVHLLVLVFLSLISTEALAQETVAHKLAIINAGQWIPPGDISVARCISLLRQLDATYVENEEQIANMTVKAQNLLREEGIKEGIISIMEGMNLLFSQPLENQKYGEYIAAYIVFRTKGRSNADAILDLQAIVRLYNVD